MKTKAYVHLVDISELMVADGYAKCYINSSVLNNKTLSKSAQKGQITFDYNYCD